MSNAMRSGKRWLAGAAAGALGAGLMTFVAVQPANAGVAATVAFNHPSITMIAQNNVGTDDSNIPFNLTLTDSSGLPVAAGDDTVNRSVDIRVTAPATVNRDDSVGVRTGATPGDGATTNLVLNSPSGLPTGNLRQLWLAPTTAGQGWSNVVSAGNQGTYTITARLFNTASGAVLSTATMSFQVVRNEGAPAATVTFLNAAGNPITNIGTTIDDSMPSSTTAPSFSFAVTNPTGGPYLMESTGDDTYLITTGGQLPAIAGTGVDTTSFARSTLGIYGVSFPAGTSNRIANSGAGTISVAVKPAGVAATGSSTLNVGISTVNDLGARPVATLTSPKAYQPDPDVARYQVPPGTTTLTFGANIDVVTTSANTLAWNATSNSRGVITPAGGVATAPASQASVTLNVNSTVATADESVVFTIGEYRPSGGADRSDVIVDFVAPTATVDAAGGLAQVATTSNIAGTVLSQYGAVLPGTWAVRLLNGPGLSCTSPSITAIATATAAADGSFSLAIPAANALTAAGTKVFTVCATNGFTTPATTPVPVTYTATGGVTSLTSAAYVGTGNSGSRVLASSVPIVQVPGSGVANLNVLTTQQLPLSSPLTAAIIQSAGTALSVTATVNPRTAMTFTGTDGVLFTEQSTGSILYSNASKSVTVVSNTATPSTAQVQVFATKPGTHTVTVSAGTTTSTLQFRAGVSRGTTRTLTVEPAKIELAPNEFRGASVIATDIFGNPVPDDTTISGALAGGGTLAPTSGGGTTDATGKLTIFYTAPLGTGTGAILWSAATGVSGTIPGIEAARLTARTDIEVRNATSKTILIVGERTTVSGKPGVRIDGSTTGFDVGSKMVPSVRFPGETEFTPGSARPTTSASGDFTWQRKTGKRVTVFFSNEAGDVRSNRVTIQAS